MPCPPHTCHHNHIYESRLDALASIPKFLAKGELYRVKYHGEIMAVGTGKCEPDNFNLIGDIPLASITVNGLMSSQDKEKLSTIESYANHYTHPSYTPQSLGFYAIEVDNEGHVVCTSPLTQEAFDALGLSVNTANRLAKAVKIRINGVEQEFDGSHDIEFTLNGIKPVDPTPGETPVNAWTPNNLSFTPNDDKLDIKVGDDTYSVLTKIPNSITDDKGNEVKFAPTMEDLASDNLSKIAVWDGNTLRTIDKSTFVLSDFNLEVGNGLTGGGTFKDFRRIELQPATSTQLGGVMICRTMNGEIEDTNEPIVFDAETVKKALETIEAGGEAISTDLIDSIIGA